MATATTYKPISWIFLRSTGLTFWTTSDTFRIRGHSVPKDPKTPDQKNSRGFLCEAKRQWATLSVNEKAAWKAFARACIHTNKREQPVKGRGIDAFMGASITRQTAGLDAMPALPVGNFVPAAPKALDLLPGNNARELAFRIEHKNSSLSSHAMLVRMTPTGKSAACTPYKSSLRHVRGVGPDSVIALPESGATVRIADTRFELEPGCIYAIEVRIMRLADGVVSEPFYTAAVREEAERTERAKEAADGANGMQAVEPVPLSPQIPPSVQTPTVNKPTVSPGKVSLVEIADRRGSKYFPSAFVLDKHFTPKTSKRKLNLGGTNIGGTMLVGKDAMRGFVADTDSGRSQDFGKLMAERKSIEKNFKA